MDNMSNILKEFINLENKSTIISLIIGLLIWFIYYIFFKDSTLTVFITLLCFLISKLISIFIKESKSKKEFTWNGKIIKKLSNKEKEFIEKIYKYWDKGMRESEITDIDVYELLLAKWIIFEEERNDRHEWLDPELFDTCNYKAICVDEWFYNDYVLFKNKYKK